MRIKVLFIFISLLVVCPTHGQDSYVSPKIEEYVDFINDCNTSPVDYVMGLFDRYDVVILGERDHRDTTQYDLIEQIMSDPRFIDQVGLIMTEIGVYNMTGTVDCIVNASYASDREFETALWDAYQNLDYTPLWENTNFHQYLCSVYRINKRLPAEKKLHISCTDVPFSWHQTEGLTHEQFQDFLHIWDYKDIVMGNNALTELYKLFDGPDPRKKALIIFNSPHSFLTGPNSRPAPYAGQIIAERFPGRVANVAINWAKRRNEYRGLTQNGKWDAAFAACGKALGSIWRARLSGRIGSTYVPASSKNDSNTKRFIPDLFFINRSESGFSGLGFRTWPMQALWMNWSAATAKSGVGRR